MNKNSLRALGGLLGLGTLLILGCQAKQPISPSRQVSVTASVPLPKTVTASLLGSTNCEILFVLQENGNESISGSSGKFSLTANTGTVNLDFSAPLGPNQILSVELLNATNQQALALGATNLNLTAGAPVTNITVELGSLVSSCYNGTIPALGDYFSFDTDAVSTDVGDGTPTGDVYFYQYGNDVDIYDAQEAANIAYMGNGNLVNFDSVPVSQFFAIDSYTSKSYYYALSSEPEPTPTACDCEVHNPKVLSNFIDYYITPGDVYCINLSTGGHAWVQIINNGLNEETGPSFQFRTNNTLPYYSYYLSSAASSAAAVTGVCGPWETLLPTVK